MNVENEFVHGKPQAINYATVVGISPNDVNAQYCLNLACDIDGLRNFDDAALAQRMMQEPRPNPAAQDSIAFGEPHRGAGRRLPVADISGRHRRYAGLETRDATHPVEGR
jgi:hypothetical protein